jgi:hypothetical protein
MTSLLQQRRIDTRHMILIALSFQQADRKQNISTSEKSIKKNDEEGDK